MDEVRDQSICLLKAFFGDMRTWQIGCRAREKEHRTGGISAEERKQRDLADLKVIFDKYCQYKTFVDSYSYRDPPSYDPENEQILEVVEDGKDIVVVTQQTIPPFQTKNRYYLRRTKDGLRLTTKRQWYDEYEKKWRRSDLLV
jgi:hypothetical protein